MRKEYGDTPSAPLSARQALVERGVRTVQCITALGSRGTITRKSRRSDCALPRHGQGFRRVGQGLEAARTVGETLVVWGGEFGRTPVSESGDGRDHNPYGFTMWMAGGGVKGGISYGETMSSVLRPWRSPYPFTTCSDDVEPDGRGPYQADLPLRRQGLPPDRCLR